MSSACKEVLKSKYLLQRAMRQRYVWEGSVLKEEVTTCCQESLPDYHLSETSKAQQWTEDNEKEEGTKATPKETKKTTISQNLNKQTKKKLTRGIKVYILKLLMLGL